MKFAKSSCDKALIILSCLGIIDAIYLTLVHFEKSLLVCPDSGIINCTQVLTSALSTIGGIPISVLGIIWFIGLLFIVIYKYKGVFSNIWLIIGCGGVAYSLIGMDIIGKICIYCSLLDTLIVLSVLIFIISNKRISHNHI